jgi:hypothetical protein
MEWFAHPQSDPDVVTCMGLLPSPPETSDSPPATRLPLLATAGRLTKKIRVWNLDAQEMVTELEMAGGTWSLVTYEASGASRLAAGGEKGIVRLFDGHTYELVAFTKHLSRRVIHLRVWTDSATGAALLIAAEFGGVVVRMDD